METGPISCNRAIMSCPEPLVSLGPPPPPPPAVVTSPLERPASTPGSAAIARMKTNNGAGGAGGASGAGTGGAGSAGGAPSGAPAGGWTGDDAADCRTTVASLVSGGQAAATTAFMLSKNIAGAFGAAFIGQVLKDRLPAIVCPEGTPKATP